MLDFAPQDLVCSVGGHLIKLFPNLNLIEALHACRAMGNDAAHRLAAFPQDEIRTAIELMENLLNFPYDWDYKALQLRKGAQRTSEKVEIKSGGFKSVKLGSVQ